MVWDLFKKHRMGSFHSVRAHDHNWHCRLRFAMRDKRHDRQMVDSYKYCILRRAQQCLAKQHSVWNGLGCQAWHFWPNLIGQYRMSGQRPPGEHRFQRTGKPQRTTRNRRHIEGTGCWPLMPFDYWPTCSWYMILVYWACTEQATEEL